MGKARKAASWVALGGMAVLAGCAAPQIQAPVDSLTVARVMGRDVEMTPLLPEAGNSVWPSDESPRGTIGNPDARVRPGEEQNLPRQTRRGSSTPPGINDAYAGPPPGLRPDLRPLNTPPAPLAPPPARADGRVIPTPTGPVVTSTGGPGYATYTSPEGATGIAIPQGGTTTLLENGRVRQVPTPR